MARFQTFDPPVLSHLLLLSAVQEAAGLPPVLLPPAPDADVLRQALELSAAGAVDHTGACFSSSSSSVVEAALGRVQPLPSSQQAGGDRELLQQAGQLWAALEGQLGRYGDLLGLVEGVLGFEAHPHAIDGAQLAAAAGLEGGEGERG
jgi:hypothetical protein